MIIAVDFDGTCVTHEYPEIGQYIGAEPVLKKLVEQGHKLILLTMRHGLTLTAAVRWFGERGIPLFGVNENSEQEVWSQSRKVFSDLYIDDAGLGVPLIYPNQFEKKRPFVDWVVVELMFRKRGIIT